MKQCSLTRCANIKRLDSMMNVQSPAARLSALSIGVFAALAPPLATAQSNDVRYQNIMPPMTATPEPSRVFNEGVYTANAAVIKIVMEVARDGIPADGQSATQVTIRLFDKNGQPVSGDAVVTVEASGGRIQVPGARTDELGSRPLDADRSVRGTQIKAKDGLVTFNLLSPIEPQDIRLRATAGSATVEGTVSFIPELREWLAVGLVEGVIRLSRKDPQLIQPVRLDDGFEQEIRKFERQFNDGKGAAAARTAFFLKGKIRGDALLTAAYDSDKETRARLLRDIRPEEFYPVYGDSSIKGFEAKSSAKLYVRIDKDKSYALFGDFATGDGFSQLYQGGSVSPGHLRTLGAYNRTMTGLRGHWEKGNVTANVFASRDSLKQVTEEFRANGTSGPFAVRNNSALENSEKVEIVVRLKDQPGVVKSVQTLARVDDYSFEPFSGRILLTRPLPSVDVNGDPVSLRITYEVDQGGENFWVAGVDGQFNLNEMFTIGGGLVQDRNPLSPYKLGSVNAGVRFGKATYLTAEVARADSTLYGLGGVTFSSPTFAAGETRVDQSGNAARIDFKHSGERLGVNAYVMRTDEDFYNPSAPLYQGRSEAGLKLSGKLTETLRLFGEAIKSEDRKTAGERKGGSVGAEIKLSEALTVSGGLRKIEENKAYNSGLNGFVVPNVTPGSSTSPSGGFFGGIDPATVNPGTGLTVPVLSPVGGPQTTQPIDVDATTLFLGARWQATAKLTLEGLIEGSIKGDDKNRAVLGGAYQIAERSRLYARAESQTGLTSVYGAGRSNLLTIGADTSYMPGGELFSEYRLRDATSRETQWANGVRNTWSVREGVTYTTVFEYLKVLDGSGASAAAIALGYDYTANPLWKLGSKLEWRRTFDGVNTPLFNERSDSLLSTITVARKLDRDWTLLARNYLLRNEYASSLSAVNNVGAPANTGVDQPYSTLQNRFQIGAAYRPVDDNRFDALGKYEYKLERNVDGIDTRAKVHIVSTHANYHPSRPWWLSGRLAAKARTDDFGPSTTARNDKYNAWLLSGRAIYDITESWDLGLLAATLRSPKGSANQYAYGAEAGYLIRQNLWLSAGYNWRGFRDDDLTASEYTSRGLFLRLRFKFDEDLFKGNEKPVNRNLTR
jgi:hypothetical protein